MRFYEATCAAVHAADSSVPCVVGPAPFYKVPVRLLPPLTCKRACHSPCRALLKGVTAQQFDGSTLLLRILLTAVTLMTPLARCGSSTPRWCCTIRHLPPLPPLFITPGVAAQHLDGAARFATYQPFPAAYHPRCGSSTPRWCCTTGTARRRALGGCSTVATLSLTVILTLTITLPLTRCPTSSTPSTSTSPGVS